MPDRVQIVRQRLLSAAMDDEKSVEHVEVARIELGSSSVRHRRPGFTVIRVRWSVMWSLERSASR